MSTSTSIEGSLVLGGFPLERVLPALRALEPAARAAYVLDLDAVVERARRLHAAFSPHRALAAYALKANALPMLTQRVAVLGLGGEAGSVGELELARAAGFDATRRVLNGNGRTPEEAAWVAEHGVHSVNADHVGELDVLERAAAARRAHVRVALRVNPGIGVDVHRYIVTGDDEAKFGISPAEALDAWAARASWPHLQLDGIHLHIGSQLMDTGPILEALDVALALGRESAGRGAALGLINLGGGFGIDYQGEGREFPLEAHADGLAERVRGLAVDLVVEPGRWLVAPTCLLLAEVLAVKPRGGRRFIVLAAGMNDLIRPALYQARHRIEPLRPRAGERTQATVVGPVCESADVFADEVELPPLEVGDVVAIHDVGAYGASMSSNYNGRGRLAELVIEGGRLIRARAGETTADLMRGASSDVLDAGA